MNYEMILAHMILEYLVKQPAAKDTYQGIVEWWLLREQISQSADNIGAALDLLISRELVIVNQYRDQEKYYQLNNDKLHEIKKVIKEFSG